MLCSLVAVFLTGQAGAFRHGDSSATLRLVDSLQRLLRAHAVAMVDADDLHVLKLFHKVPLVRLFGVMVMFLIWNSIVWVSLACSRLETLFGSQSVLKKRLLPGKVLARGTRG